jgi:iron complex outermembrane receptor protein
MSRLASRRAKDTTKFRLSGDYSKLYTSLVQQLAPGVTGIDGLPGYRGRFDTEEGFTTDFRSKQWGVALHVDQELDFAKLVSITSYRSSKGTYNTDLDNTPAPVFSGIVHQRTNDFTQELQLLSNSGSDVKWVLGAFYFHGKAGNDPVNLAGAPAAPFPYVDMYGIQKVNSGSIYGQATKELFAATNLTVGLRYTNEKVSINGRIDAPGAGTIFVQPTQSQKLSRLTWRVALDHDFSNDIKGYISYNRGIKSGGFNLFLPTSEFKPETLDSYEAGLKTELFDRHLRLNMAGFYYDYKNIQVTTIQSGGTTSGNAAKARIYGVDFDFMARLGKLNLSGGGSYLNGRYRQYPGAIYYPQSPMDPLPSPVPNDAAGNPTTYTPKWTANAQADYTIPASFGDVTLSGSVAYFSGSSADPFNTIRNPSYTLLNSSVSWKVSDNLSARLWVRNITDANYVSARFASAFGTIQLPAPPRTYGGTISFEF